MRYSEIMRFAMGTTWAIERSKLQLIAGILALRAQGKRLTKAEVRRRIAPFAARGSGEPSRAGSVAVVPIRGFLSKRAGMMSDVSGGTSTDELCKMFRSLAADESVSAVVLDVDSGGGTVPGTPECFAALMDLRAVKKVLAVVNATAGSAAYWLTSAATEVWSIPSGKVGSIGVFTVHEDLSEALKMEGVSPTIIQAGKYKTEETPLGPLSDEARAAIQKDVNDTYAMFVRDVARGRGVAQKAVLSGFGEGRMVSAKDALAEGMIDEIGTLDEAVASLMGSRRRAAPATATAAEDVHVPVVAAAAPPPAEVLEEKVPLELEEAAPAAAAAPGGAQELEIRRRRLRLAGSA